MPADSWVDPGLGVEMETSGRALTGQNSLWLEILWCSSVLDSVLPPQRLRLDSWPGTQMLQAAQLGKKGKKEDKYGIKTNKQNQDK